MRDTARRLIGNPSLSGQFRVDSGRLRDAVPGGASALPERVFRRLLHAGQRARGGPSASPSGADHTADGRQARHRPARPPWAPTGLLHGCGQDPVPGPGHCPDSQLSAARELLRGRARPETGVDGALPGRRMRGPGDPRPKRPPATSPGVSSRPLWHGARVERAHGQSRLFMEALVTIRAYNLAPRVEGGLGQSFGSNVVD